jgi:N-carbamoyl-L-amino-acid hydrolase
LAVNQERLLSEIEALARISEAPPPAVTRIVFTPKDLEARAWLRTKFEEAGLLVLATEWISSDALH